PPRRDRPGDALPPEALHPGRPAPQGARGPGRPEAVRRLLAPLPTEAVAQPHRQRARRYHVGPAEDREDVVDAPGIEGVEQVGLDRYRDVVTMQVEAQREGGDGTGLDAARVEIAAVVDHDEGG